MPSITRSRFMDCQIRRTMALVAQNLRQLEHDLQTLRPLESAGRI